MAKPGQIPGSYSLGDSELFRRLGEERSPSATLQRVPPEMRFGRPVNLQRDGGINSHVRAMWHEYLDTIGQKNYGKGKAVALGSLVVTHVTAVEMSKMLGRKMPDLFSERPNHRKILQAYRGIKGEYDDFTRGRDREIADMQSRAVEGDEVSQEDFERNAKLWGVAGFALANQPDNFGKCDLSVVFTEDDRQLLTEEMRETWQFLKEQRLDTSQIDKSRVPHLSVFDAFHPLGSVVLKGAVIPQEIVLMQPHAFISDNSPSITV